MEYLLKDIVKEDTYTNTGGETLYSFLKESINRGELMIISLDGISSFSSSFLNSSFGAIISDLGYDKLRQYVNFKDVSRGVADILRAYLDDSKAINA